MVLNYTKNKEVYVFEQKQGMQEIKASMTDMFFGGQVQMQVAKTMEIINLTAKIDCTYSSSCKVAQASLDKMKGRKIGGGITKIVHGVVGKECPYLASLVMECIEAAILGVTVGPLESAVPQLISSPDFTKVKLIKFMPHMKNSCVAYTLTEEEETSLRKKKEQV